MNLNSFISGINFQTATIAVLVGWVSSTFWAMNNNVLPAIFGESIFPLKGRTATIVAAAYGFVCGAYMFTQQHGNWHPLVGSLLIQGIQVGVYAVTGFTIAQPAFKAVHSIHVKNTAVANAALTAPNQVGTFGPGPQPPTA